MSLAPGERLALTRIEDRLRGSDPDLAAKLERFGLPRVRKSRRLAGWQRRRPVLLILMVAGVLLSILLAVAVFHPIAASARPCGGQAAQTAQCRVGSGNSGHPSGSARRIAGVPGGK